MTDISIDAGAHKLTASVYGRNEGTPVLLLHAISFSRDTWAETAMKLADRYHVWTLDFRGHGDSARSARYELSDYVKDAEAALRMIDRPTILVGHSLGACVAGMLAQNAHPSVRAAYLEEPPWYLGEVAEWEKTYFPKKFATVSVQQAQWQSRNTPLSEYLAFLSAAPWPAGGVASDHTTPRHLLSHASALQRQDNRCWSDAGAGGAGSGLSAIDTTRPFRCPVKVVAGEAHLGSAFLDDHGARLAAVNRDVEIVRYVGSGHEPHRIREFERRFADDLGNFIARFED